MTARWRYWITYEGTVTTEGDSETEAQKLALDDVTVGSKWPTIEVEPLGGGEGA